MRNFAFLLFIFIYSCSDNISVEQDSTNDFYENAWKYMDNDDNINAFIEFGKSKEIFLKKKDSFGAGKCLINMAIIQEKMGDYFGSQETAIGATSYFDIKNKKHQEYITSNYNTLGIANRKMQNYGHAIEFYTNALELSTDIESINICKNNLANSYGKEKKYIQAIKIFQNLKNNITKKDKEYARISSNLAITKWLQNHTYNPILILHEALKIRLKVKDNWGLNSSYSHLADYYADKQKDSALVYANKMYGVSREIKSPDDQIEALEKLISLEESNNSKQYFKVYQKLNDSLLTARNKAKNQFALIRYETEKNKADFLKSQAESTGRQNHIIKQYFGIGFLLFLLIVIYFYIKRNKKIHQQEKLLEVKNTELKYSKKVHDRVANRIYQIISQVENKEHIDRDSLLFGLENVYETSRDISYENEEISESKNYAEQLHNMLDSYSSDSVQVIFNGNNEKLWEGVNFQIKTEVYLILQELMTNMKKHSQADKIFLKFINDNTHVNISYTDNGVGIKDHSPKNGIQNMENRINSINGKINFDTETNNLLKINISFPI